MSTSGAVANNTVVKSRSTRLMLFPAPGYTSRVLMKVWRWVTSRSSGILTRGAARRLRVMETVALGEKRFVSILHVDGEQFLVGGSSSHIVLLAKLDPKAEGLDPESFERVLSRTNCRAAGIESVSYSGNEVTQ
jgi:hypothetical protein